MILYRVLNDVGPNDNDNIYPPNQPTDHPLLLQHNSIFYILCGQPLALHKLTRDTGQQQQRQSGSLTQYIPVSKTCMFCPNGGRATTWSPCCVVEMSLNRDYIIDQSGDYGAENFLVYWIMQILGERWSILKIGDYRETLDTGSALN